MIAMQPTLLVVDDDSMNREMLARRLTRQGFRMLVAENGTEALSLIERHRIDAVLLDSIMPGLSGLDTLRRLRQSRSSAELPVIMVTGKDRSEDVVEALELGANDYVTKPIDFAVVLARIKTQVSVRRADPLTGLANRLQFIEQVERRLARFHREPAAPFAVLFIDIDRFKLINDSLGHLAGDELLVSVARRLEGALRNSDTVARAVDHTVARFGGDEFTILLDRIDGLDAAEAIAARLLGVASTPVTVQGREIFTTLSIGLVMSATRYEQAEAMLRDADTAMYRAKSRGKARVEVFDVSMRAAVEEQVQLEADLRQAIPRNELEIHYQPIVALGDNRLCGFEALLRWRHPNRGLFEAIDVIPLAEESGLMVPIGTWVLGEACRQMRAWDADFPDSGGLMMNVNVSAKQLVLPSFVDDVRRVLAETGMPAERLKLEIAENVVLENSAAVETTLTQLRTMGVQLGLDDFGMGYSALGYLQRLPFQTLKIDRAFVMGMQQLGNSEIIRAIISMAEALAMTVTAEGIETAQQAADLKGLECGFGQGFFFREPLTRDAAEKLLRERQANPVG